MSGVGDSSGVHSDPVHPIEVLLGLYPANAQVTLMSGRYGTSETSNACNRWSDIVVLKHSTVDVVLQDLVSVSDARQCTCDIYNSHPTAMTDSCPHHDTANTKSVDLLHAVSLDIYGRVHPSARNRTNRDSSENKTVLHVARVHPTLH